MISIGPAHGDGLFHVRIEGPHRLAAGVVEVIVRRVLGRDQGNLHSFGHREEAGGADGLKPDARIGIGGQLLEPIERIRHPVAPVAEHARGRGPGAEIARGQQPAQQLDVHDIVKLVDPQGLQQVVLIIDIVLIQVRDPFA